MARNLENLRNIGIIAHIDAGKTTRHRADAVLHRRHAPDGRRRQGHHRSPTSIPKSRNAASRSTPPASRSPGRTATVNLIDTPGHVDFTAEVERSLRVLDGGVVVFSAREGVEAQSETVWRQADKYNVPRMAFINKMDREGADFYGTFEEIRKRLGGQSGGHPDSRRRRAAARPRPVPRRDRSGRMKMLTFTPESQGAEIVAQPTFPPNCTTRPSCGASRCSTNCSTTATS